MLNRILEQQNSSNKLLRYLQDTAIDYINNIGSETLTETSNLRKQIKYSIKGYKLNPTKTFLSIVTGLKTAANIGFYFKIKKTISCSCSAFYGKKLEILGLFHINCSEFLLKHKSDPMPNLYQSVEIPFKSDFNPDLLCPDRSCPGSTQEEKVELDTEPKSFIISLIWESDPDSIEILKILSALRPTINFNSILDSKKTKNFSFKGLVLQQASGEFVYCTSGPDSEFFIIQEKKYLKVAGGTWLDAVYNLAVYGFKPLLVLYCKSKQVLEEFMQIDELETLEMAVAQQTGKFSDWVCLCCDAENLAESENCRRCGIGRQSKVKQWECKCGFTNKAFTTICSFCHSFRFEYNTGKCGICKQNKVGKECVYCNRFKCGIVFCMNEVVFGQFMVHMKCGQACSGYCETCNERLNKYNCICFLCHDICGLCQVCKIMHIKNRCPATIQFNCNICYESLHLDQAMCKYCRLQLFELTCVYCKSNIDEASVCSKCLNSFNSE